MIPPCPALLPSEGYTRRTEAASATLERLQRLCQARGIAPSAVGRAIAGDSRLIYDLRAGREIGKRLSVKIDAFLAQQEAING
jgi:hypothetical protein